MKLVNIKITKLFDILDYDIPLENEENLKIITGPNGFGKTMILNIIYNLSNDNFSFFQKLVFEEIVLVFDNNISVKINKKVKNKNESEIKFRFFDGNKNEEKLIYNNAITDIERDGGNSELINPYQIFKVHLIKEQRLFKETEEQNGYMTDTIQEYAKELSQKIFTKLLEKSFHISQDLDGSFPKRLLSETGKLTAEEFNRRFSILKNKQNKLKEYGLSESEQEVPDFDQENARVLLVYLKDTEKKIGAFDNLLTKLELFTNILNDRRFTFKSIKIHKEKGFTFLTDQGKELSLTDLSSGEQHEVVLLYELIFKTEENTLVLIDEPEISLHITWQKEFLNDILRIIDLQKMQVIVATHSPQIINGRWDLVYNLEKAKN
jgi:predicted ATP-binding protein involved in virulence